MRLLLLQLQVTVLVISSCSYWCSAFVPTTGSSTRNLPPRRKNGRTIVTQLQSSKSDNNGKSANNVFVKKEGKGRILILGGSGFLGENIACRAIREGYAVTSISRRGRPAGDNDACRNKIDYRIGDARDLKTIEAILNEDALVDDSERNSSGSSTALSFVAVVHCIGLLFDTESKLGRLNRFVSGSGSRPGDSSTYDDVTRLTAFHAISAAESYAKKRGKRIPFIFTSAAEAGWPDVRGGQFIENSLAPKWLRRYLAAKRAVESELLKGSTVQYLRPVIFRPSLIYSLDKALSLPPVGAFYVGNRLGLPFVDRPVTVQKLSIAAVRAVCNDEVEGVQRFQEIDELSG